MWWLEWGNDDNNRLPLRIFSMHTVRTSIKDKKIVKNSLKFFMLATVLEKNLSPWSDKKSSEKYAPVERSGWRTSRFKIYKS